MPAGARRPIYIHLQCYGSIGIDHAIGAAGEGHDQHYCLFSSSPVLVLCSIDQLKFCGRVKHLFLSLLLHLSMISLLTIHYIASNFQFMVGSAVLNLRYSGPHA